MPALVLAIDSDRLFPPVDQDHIAAYAPATSMATTRT